MKKFRFHKAIKTGMLVAAVSVLSTVAALGSVIGVLEVMRCL